MSSAPPVRELHITVRDADPARVEATVGPPLYTYLRGLPVVIEFRRQALNRALAAYEAAVSARAAESELAARGLLVLQRAFLPVEDLGALLVALRAPDPFVALTSYGINDIDQLFLGLFQRVLDPADVFKLPQNDVIQREKQLTPLQRRAARQLRNVTAKHLARELHFVGYFWMGLRHVAKNTMHGFGFVSSAHLLGPPAAGTLVEMVEDGQPRPFVLSLITQHDRPNLHLNTEHQTVELTREVIELMARSGLAACDLSDLLQNGWCFQLRTGGFALPMTCIDKLSAEERAALQEVRETDDDG